MEEKIYCLELREEHINALIAACDLYLRVNLGQLDEIGRIWSIKHYIANTGVTLHPPEVKAAEHHLKRAKKILTGQGNNASFGLGAKQVGEKAHICYEIEKVLRHRNWLDNSDRSYVSVDSSGPLHYSTVPFPIIRKKKNGKPRKSRKNPPSPPKRKK